MLLVQSGAKGPSESREANKSCQTLAPEHVPPGVLNCLL